jgi:DNA-binding response OmpR family regulator
MESDARLAPRMRVLIIEDEPKMLLMLRDGLREHGHTVMTAADGQEGLNLAHENLFDAILLDVLLPNLSGWQVLHELKRSQNPALVLMLTACDGEAEVIAGLDGGADDYLTKPFSFLELLARLRSLERWKSSNNHKVCVETLVLDRERHQAFRGSQCLDLTRTEMALLDCLLKSRGEIVPRAALVEAVWGQSDAVSRSTVDSFINLLRKKVDPPGEPRLLHTIKGAGYSIHAKSLKEMRVQGKAL